MTFIPWPDSVKIVLRWTLGGIPVTITLAAAKPGGFNLTEQTTLSDDINNWVTTNVQPDMASTLTYQGCTATDMRTSTGPVVVRTLAVPVNGGVAGQSIDIGSAMIISPRTANRGRSGRGRKYLPGMSNAGTVRQDAANFSAAAVAQQLANFSLLDGAMNLTGFSWVIPSEQLNGAVRNPAVIQEVTSIIVDTPIGNRRGRGLFS